MFLDKANNILVVRFSSLGDILLTTPVLRALANKYIGVKVDYIVKRQYEDALKHNPSINKLYSFEEKEPSPELIAELRRNSYDFVVDLQSSGRSKKFVEELAMRTYSYVKPTLNKIMLVNFKFNLYKKVKQIPEMYAEAVPNLTLDDKGLELFIPNEIKPILQERGEYIGISPGSKHYTKRWLPEYFAELGGMLNKAGYIVVIFGGRDDKEICNNINGKVENSINLCNDDKLLQTAADMKMCKAIVCNDSGMMHTASAVGVPFVALFGSTVKQFGFFPYKAQSLVLENKSLSCRPCSHIGKSSCPKEHFKCMRDLTPELDYNNLISFISNK